MPEAVVRGIHINYEVIGNSGPWIALTPGSRRSYGELVDLSKAIAASGYRVLLHDRRNCGASDVAFDGSGSEHEVWADDLHELGHQLRRVAAGGRRLLGRRAAGDPVCDPASAGDLRGMLLWRVTGGQEAVDRLAEKYYGQFIKIARAGGMQAVCESEHFSECIKARPSNRDRLLATDPEQFIKVMTFWRERFLESASAADRRRDRSRSARDKGTRLPDRRQRRHPHAGHRAQGRQPHSEQRAARRCGREALGRQSAEGMGPQGMARRGSRAWRRSSRHS